MWKECEQIILPTEGNKFSKLKINDCDGKLDYSIYGCQLDIYKQIYVTSDDEIIVNDWFICDKKVYKATEVDDIQCFFAEGQSCTKKYCRKIIAATDESLEFIKHELYPSGNTMGIRSLNEIPKLSLDWIKYTCAEINSIGGFATKVLVEYEDEGICRFHHRDGGYDDRLSGGNLKINNDNTINIKLLKNNFTIEEVIELCRDSWNNSTADDYEACYCFADWLRENNFIL